MNLKERIEQIGKEKREVYRIEKREPKTWIEKRKASIIEWLGDFIDDFKFVNIEIEFKGGHVYVDIFVAIAGRTIFSDRIKVI